jgi:prolyl-tRNA synthetase
MSIAEDIYDKLTKGGLDVMLDDRDERTGVKFKDADLIGIPVRITVGRKAEEGIVEVKERINNSIVEMDIQTVIEFCKEKMLLG